MQISNGKYGVMLKLENKSKPISMKRLLISYMSYLWGVLIIAVGLFFWYAVS